MDADRSSFEAYVRARTVALSRIAYLLTSDHYLAEDLVQQTFLRVAGRWRRITAAGDPDPYVRKVLYHQHISWWRRTGRIAVVVPGGVGASGAELGGGREAGYPGRATPGAAVTGGTSVPDAADQVAITVTVRSALAKLAPKQRAALVLRYFEDFTEAQTAEILGCRVGTVKSQVRDGLARLRVLAPELAELMEVGR